MSRPGVDYETVKHAAVKLLSQGIAPSVQKIREVLGTGSNNTIATHLKIWRDEYAKKSIHHLPANMPKELIASFEVLWQIAMAQAHDQLATHKQSLESRHEEMLQEQLATQKNTIDLKQKLADITNNLEKEILEKQELITELAVSNDRLKKKDEVFTAQKNHYETSLKRAYEEKENIAANNSQLQNEIKLLQEKLIVQAEEHQKLLTQKNISQEQSENRWLKLIDQAREETKESNKKLENLRLGSAEEMKKVKNELAEARQIFYEKNAELKTALAQISNLKNEVKILKEDNMKSRSAVMKLNGEEKQKKSVKNSKNRRVQMKK